MFRLDSEDDLRVAFRPRDRKLLELTSDLEFPLDVQDYAAWLHPAGGRVFLVFAAPGDLPTGIVFDTNDGTPGPAVAHMCTWCHSPGEGTTVGLLTTALSGRKRVGVHVCTDLSCRRKLQDDADRSGRSVRPSMEKLVARMGDFAREGLGIDLRNR